MLMTIRIKNLSLRAIIGVNPWERSDKQAVTVNVEMEFDGAEGALADDIALTVDYRDISRRLIEHVESSSYQLIEALAASILALVLSDGRVLRATVEVDKPHAVKSAESVSVVVFGSQSTGRR